MNAPVAVSGFVVAIAMDNKGYEGVEKANVRLNARLLAKLVTESYYAPPFPISSTIRRTSSTTPSSAS